MGEAKRNKSLADFFREAVDDPDVQEAMRLMEQAAPEAAKRLAVMRSVEPLVRYAAEELARREART